MKKIDNTKKKIFVAFFFVSFFYYLLFFFLFCLLFQFFQVNFDRLFTLNEWYHSTANAHKSLFHFLFFVLRKTFLDFLFFIFVLNRIWNVKLLSIISSLSGNSFFFHKLILQKSLFCWSTSFTTLLF